MRTPVATVCLMLALLPSAGRSEPGLRRGSAQADAIDAPRITMQDFKKLLAANNVVVVDSRNADEFAKSHMKGALPLPLEGRLTWPDQYEKTVSVLQKTRKPVVVYCA